MTCIIVIYYIEYKNYGVRKFSDTIGGFCVPQNLYLLPGRIQTSAAVRATGQNQRFPTQAS